MHFLGDIIAEFIFSFIFLSSVYGAYLIMSMGMFWLALPYLWLLYLGYKKLKK